MLPHRGAPTLHRALLIGALLLIDFLYFDPFGHADESLRTLGTRENVYHR